MGQFTCFLGSEYDSTVPFVRLPEFVYYYSIVTLIMTVNAICFLITGFYLTSHWVTVRSMQRRSAPLSILGSLSLTLDICLSCSQDVWNHALVVSKLFLIMGIHIYSKTVFNSKQIFRNPVDF